MRRRLYLLLSLVCSVLATAGADVIARTSVADWALGPALREQLDASNYPISTLMQLAPFVAVGLFSDSMARRGFGWAATATFSVGVLVLSYFYFGGYRASQQALLDEMWTASALEVGLLPFLVGIPVVGCVAFAWGWTFAFDGKPSEIQP